jgi:dTDP-4-dehydrorhamnose reductase
MITILGASGYLGRIFIRYFERNGIRYSALSRSRIDYYDPATLERACSGASFVINAAGFTGKPNVDACEDHKTQCLLANTVLPGIIAEVCQKLDLPWGHLSSGCIYTGCRADGGGFRESDPPNFSFRQNNCSFYSGCKALGEEVLGDDPRCYVWRIRLPFNHLDHPRNYLSKLLQYERLLDACNSLSDIDEVVAACHACWTGRLEYGIYHLTNRGSVTTRQIVELMRRHRVTNQRFQFFASEEEFLRVAVRTPRSNCVLDNSKALAAGLHLSPVDEALDRALRYWTHDRRAPGQMAG